jgi:hypothetical protein
MLFVYLLRCIEICYSVKQFKPPKVTMIDRTHMTIDAYLRQAGIKPNFPESSKNVLPLKRTAVSPFNDLLQAARLTDDPGTKDSHRGATISDYLSLCTVASTVPTTPNRLTLQGNVFRSMVPSSHQRGGSGSFRQEQASHPKEINHELIPGSANETAECGPVPCIHQSIRTAAQKYNLSEELIRSVIQAESNFRPDAVSPAGAKGLMQLMPATARELGVTDPFDVEQNIDGGARYLKKMVDRFNGDIKLALAAYNAGPGTVERYNGNVPYPETQRYIQRVLSGMLKMENTIG